MSKIIVVIPICNDISKSSLEMFTKIFLRSTHVDFCISHSSSKLINQLSFLEKKFPNVFIFNYLKERDCFSSLVYLAMTDLLKVNNYSFYGTICLFENPSIDSLLKQIQIIKRSESGFSVFFGDKYKYTSVKKRLFVKILNLYAKYYLNFDLNNYSIRQLFMSHEFACEFYKKRIPVNFLYELFFLKSFSDYIYSNLEPIDKLN